MATYLSDACLPCRGLRISALFIRQLIIRVNRKLASHLAKMSVEDTLYGYFPSKAVSITFLSLYGASSLWHAAQATYYRAYWLFATAVFCGAIEILGWSGRLWSSISPFTKTPFQIQ